MAKKKKKTGLQLTWNPSNFTKLLEDNYVAFKGEIQPIMEDGMNRISNTAKENIRRSKHVYKGKAIGSVLDLTQMYGKMAFRVGGGNISLNILEWGRGEREQMPPISAIKEWGEFKGLNLTDMQAFYIAKDIGRFGIEATKPILKAFKKERAGIMNRVKNSTKGIIKRLGFVK